MSNSDDYANDELRMLYEVTVADLSYFKSQQWAVTNYALLLHVAVVGIHEMLTIGASTCDKVILTLVTLFVVIAAGIVLKKLQDSILIRQSRLDSVRTHFGAAFHAAWSSKLKDREYIHSVYFLYGAILIATLLANWLLWFRV